MPKIILFKDGVLLKEMPLFKERISIGRRTGNELVIADPAISSEHAVIVTRDNDFYLEDLNSTNGTQVNGQPVRMHFLQDQDVIELARYRIKFLLVEGSEAGPGNATGKNPSQSSPLAFIRVLSGPRAGHETVLKKPVTTVGRPDEGVLAIVQRGAEYEVSRVDGHAHPTVNGKSIGNKHHRLKDGDLIELSGSQLKFVLQESDLSG